MSIKAYDNIPDNVLDQVHTTQEGKSYTIRCSEKLAVDMKFSGKTQPSSNSQGWERSSTKYFQQLHQNHPEMFSAKNVARIQNNQAPIVDQKIIDHNPQYAQFKGEQLVHHHVGGDGQAVAVPRSIHKGFGEIHNHEKNAGITQNCREFSERCDRYVQNHPDQRSKSASEMSRLVGAKPSQSPQNAAPSQTGKGQQSNPRSAAVKSTLQSHSSQSGSRASAVHAVSAKSTSGQSQGHTGGQSR